MSSITIAVSLPDKPVPGLDCKKFQDLYCLHATGARIWVDYQRGLYGDDVLIVVADDEWANPGGYESLTIPMTDLDAQAVHDIRKKEEEPQYPEHDKLLAVKDSAEAAGEFLEWLQSEGISLMTWRTDMTDTRPTDPECRARIRQMRDGGYVPLDCDLQAAEEVPEGTLETARWRSHCKHWLLLVGPARGTSEKRGVCCHCEKGRTYEITLSSGVWAADRRSIEQLLADWLGIDRDKIEAEKRQILAGLGS